MPRSSQEHEAAFAADPHNVDAFAALRRAYKKGGDFAKLAALCERRAGVLEEADQAAELLWEAAELHFSELRQPGRGEELLRRVLDRSPAHMQAAERLKTICRDAGRFTDYADVLARQVEALEAAHAEPRRLADLHHELGTLYEEHFARLDRAMEHFQAAFKLDPSLSAAIERGRRIYRSLGDWQMVARLYELEIEVAPNAARRAELLVALGRVQAERLGQYGPAALRLQEAARLRDDDEKVLEALGGVLAHPDFPEPGGLEQAAQIFLGLGKKRLSAGDGEAAASYLRRALGADPDNQAAAKLLEETYQALERWVDLDRLYRQGLATARGADAIDLLMRRAHLNEERLDDRKEAKRCYEAILQEEAVGGAAAERLERMYVEDGDWEALAALKQAGLERAPDANARTALRVELGRLYTDKVGDTDAAAAMWMAVLEDEALHEVAFAAYAEYLKKRHDYRALADLYEFSVEAMQTAGVEVGKQITRLEEIADLAEKRLGDVERAVAAWKHIEELQGGRPTDRTRDALKRLLAKAKMWEGLIGVLEKEAREAKNPQARAEVLRRMAQVYREKQVDPRRAIALYEEALEVLPGDPVSMRALADLYEKENDWAGHAQTLRRLLELAQAKVERLNLLRRLAQVYAEKVDDIEEATWACTEILESVPGDRDALGRLEDLLERAQRWPRLLKTLEYHAETAATPIEKARILKRMAQLTQGQLEDELEALTRWEAVRKLTPDDVEAFQALGELYEKMGRWNDLIGLCDRRLHRAAAGSPEQLELLRRLGRAAVHAGEPLRATKAWRRLLEMEPEDREGLAALVGLLRTQDKEKSELAELLGRMAGLEPDPQAAAALALERARLLGDLGQLERAADTLEQLLRDLDPRQAEAHAMLRRVYESTGDFAKAVRVAERELFLCQNSDERVRRGMEIAALWRDKLNDPRRAVQAYERVLELSPGHVQAQATLAPLYLETGDRLRFLELQERRIEQEVDPGARHALLTETAQAAENKLGDPELAFAWRRRAYNDRPEPEEMDALVGVAERHRLWELMIQFYDAVRADAQAPALGLDAARKVAEICEKKLGDPKRALAVMRDALPSDPEAREILGELERLADAAADPQALLDIYARVGRARREVSEKVELLRLRAIVREERQKDASGAMDEHLLAFQLSPDDEQTRDQLMRLAEATGRWEDLLRTEALRFAHAPDTPGKLGVARRAAAVVEEKLGDRVRAFRAYLNAFRLAPADAEILGHLWRLAGEIGEYKPPGAEAAQEPKRPWGKEPTQEVPMSEVEVMESKEAAAPQTRDPTLELDANLLRELAVKPDREPTLELSTQDLSNLVQEARKKGPPRRPPGAAPGVRAAGMPPPPPRAALAAGARSPTPAKGTPVVLNVKSAWEELALAYETLPLDGAGNAPAAESASPQIARLLQIADVWERGAGELDRAFETLEKAFRMDPDDTRVRQAIEKLGQTHNAWDRVCAIYLKLADEGGSAHRNVALHMDVARVRENEGRTDLAEQQYEAALAIDPSQESALARLEELYRQSERWADLASLLERRTAGLLERLPTGAQRTVALRELAELYEARLGKPYEAIDAALRLAQEDAQNPDTYALLARLYTQVALWAKVVESLGKEAELSDRSRALEARRRIAEIFEQHLELPERAVEAYRTLLENEPNDEGGLAALDRLFQNMGRWKELEAILRRRAGRAEGEARAELLRRRAQLLDEKMGDVDAAANALKELRAVVGDQAAVTERLLHNLRKAGRAREAATLLNERIAALESANAPPLEVAAVLTELGVLRAGALSDETGGRKTLERALKLVPGYPPALAELARLHLGGADYRGYAAAREREAEVQSDPVRAASALIEAASVYREHLGDVEKAKAGFGRAFQLDPGSRAAVSGLLRIAEEEERWDVAYALARKRLELAEAPREKAEVLVALANAAQHHPPAAEEARGLLEEAVALAPDYVPAVERLASIEFAAERYADVEQLIERALGALGSDAEQAARLQYRLGECYDRLGKLDEGYRALLEADKASSGQLMIRLALGENRFRARRWREAALHLGAVGEHKDALKYPDQVAQGLVHAAEAELKQRRAEKVPLLYEAALRIKPDCADALRALGEMAAKAGDRAGATAYQEREGVARGDPVLLERTGDTFLELDDAAGARRAYERALVALAPGAAPPVALLEKLLRLQREAADLEAAQKTAILLVAAESEPQRRAPRRRVAAAIAHARGDVTAALEHWTSALEDDPSDEIALLAIGEVGDPRETVALYTRMIHHLPPPGGDAEALERRAALWEKLGLMRRDVTHDPRGAMEALEQAVAIDPDRLAAREALAELYGDAHEHAQAALANHRALLAIDILRVSSLRAIAHIHVETFETVKARCVYQVLELVAGLNDSERAWLAQSPPRAFEPDDAYPGILGDDDRAKVAHPKARALATVFATLYEGAPTLYGRGFESYGCTPQDRVSPVSTMLAAQIFGQVSRALGNRKTGLYLKRDRGLDGIAILSHPPTGVLIGPRIAEATPTAELRFLLGRALELARPEYILAASADPKEFTQLFAAVLRAYHPRHSRRRGDPGGVGELAGKLKKLLPYTASKRLAELFQHQQAVTWSSADWRNAVRLSATRVGLLMCGDVRTAVRILVRENEPDLPEEPPPAQLAALIQHSEPLRDLLTFALSEEYFAARAKLMGD